MNRIKVLQLGKYYAPQRGGIESHLKTLCEGILPEVDVQAVVSNTSNRTVRELYDGVALTRVARLAHLRSTSFNPAMAAQIRAHRAEIVHLHWPNPMAAVAFLASGHPGRLIVTYHCDVVRQRVLRHLFSPVLSMLLRRASRVIVSSQQYLDSSSALASYRPRCRVIPLGIAEHFFAEPDPFAVHEVQLRFGSPLVLSVGRLVDYKGLDYLIQAIQQTSVHLLVVGEGPRKRRLKRLVESLGLSHRVTFLGELPDRELGILYHAADLLVLPSVDRSEAFGLVQAEAMAAGTPVINTALDTGVSYVSPAGATGLTVPACDTTALAESISRLLKDEPYRATLGIAARARADQLFRAGRMCASTTALYREVCSSR